MKIFVIIFDTLRKDHTGKTYGNDWIKTPNFDNFAKDSIVFDNAYPESLPTIPVRRAIHTGLRTFPFNHRKPILRTDDMVFDPGWNPIPPQHKHISEYLGDFKYKSAFITSTYHQFKPNMNFHMGFDQWNWIRGHEVDKFRAQMRKSPEEIQMILDQHALPSRKSRAQAKYQKFILKRYFSNVQYRESEFDYFPALTFQKAAEFAEDTARFEDVFSLIDEFDPHEPWDPPDHYLELYRDNNYSGNDIIQPVYSEKLKRISEEEVEYLRSCYAGEVSLCDNWFGYFINKLKDLEIYNESLIFLISDHGHSIGEHNAMGKIPMCMYPELVDIPFMIKPPGNLNGPKRIQKTYVYNHDILPTIFGFLGKDQPEVFEGIDLSLFVKEDDHLIEGRDYITCGFSLCTLYKDDKFALITSNDKKYQKLYDLGADPNWNNNITEQNAEIYKDLYQKIEKDAKNDLLMEIEHTSFDEINDWYMQKKIREETEE